MGKFINPFTDVGFKKIFGQEVSKDLLIDFLNDLLVGERSIKDITFLDKELLPEYMGDRGVIYDIYCTTEAGEHIIVDKMQNRQQTNFKGVRCSIFRIPLRVRVRREPAGSLT